MLIFSRFRRAKISGMKSVNLLKTEKKLIAKPFYLISLNVLFTENTVVCLSEETTWRMREVSTLKIVSLHGVSADVEKYDE